MNTNLQDLVLIATSKFYETLTKEAAHYMQYYGSGALGESPYDFSNIDSAKKQIEMLQSFYDPQEVIRQVSMDYPRDPHAFYRRIPNKPSASVTDWGQKATQLAEINAAKVYDIVSHPEMAKGLKGWGEVRYGMNPNPDYKRMQYNPAAQYIPGYRYLEEAALYDPIRTGEIVNQPWYIEKLDSNQIKTLDKLNRKNLKHFIGTDSTKYNVALHEGILNYHNYMERVSKGLVPNADKQLQELAQQHMSEWGRSTAFNPEEWMPLQDVSKPVVKTARPVMQASSISNPKLTTTSKKSKGILQFLSKLIRRH